MKNLQTLSIEQLTNQLILHYDGNAGEILYGLKEMGIKGDKLKAALISYLKEYHQFSIEDHQDNN